MVQPTGASHAVVQPRAAPARRQEQRRQPLAANNGSILSRIGKPGVSASGTPVSFENLNFDIMKDDIGMLVSALSHILPIRYPVSNILCICSAELCSTVGELKNAEIIYDNSGRSTVCAPWLGCMGYKAGRCIVCADLNSLCCSSGRRHCNLRPPQRRRERRQEIQRYELCILFVCCAHCGVCVSRSLCCASNVGLTLDGTVMRVTIAGGVCVPAPYIIPCCDLCLTPMSYIKRIPAISPPTAAGADGEAPTGRRPCLGLPWTRTTPPPSA